MAMFTENWESWLTAKLDSLGLDVEVFQGYVEGILDDDSEPIEERAESVEGIVQGAMEDGKIDENFKADLCARWQHHKSKNEYKELAIVQERTDALKAEAALRQAEDLRLAREAEEAKMAAKQRRELADQERLALLDTYDIASGKTDENGNAEEDSEGEEDMSGVEVLGNGNRSQIKEAERAKREASKAAHAQEVLKGKQHKLDMKLKKEQSQQRAKKGERKPRG